MTNPHLTQAREWAKSVGKIEDLMSAPRAAVEVIQSLPDHWIDAEKLREVLTEQYMKREGSDTKWINAATIESLLAPPLPTLYKLVVEQKKNPEEYRWMQAKAFHTGEQGCVTDFDLYREIATVIFPNGVMKNVPWEEVTPLPDLPRLEWPGDGVVDAEIVDDEPAPPRPEDVPAGEAWMILRKGHGWVGTRDSKDGANLPWALSRLDGVKAIASKDLDITLVSRLVPEGKP